MVGGKSVGKFLVFIVIRFSLDLLGVGKRSRQVGFIFCRLMKIDWEMTVGFYAGVLFSAILWHLMNREIPLGDIMMHMVRFNWGLFDGWLFMWVLGVEGR